jgi:hypothetical protein
MHDDCNIIFGGKLHNMCTVEDMKGAADKRYQSHIALADINCKYRYTCSWDAHAASISAAGKATCTMSQMKDLLDRNSMSD